MILEIGQRPEFPNLNEPWGNPILSVVSVGGVPGSVPWVF